MYLERLSLTDFRSYAQVDLSLSPGVTVLVGSNGLGKTNLVEAVGYLSSLGSHRVSSDVPLLRMGTDQALIRGALVRGGRRLTLEVEINANRANRARINRANPVRARDILGLCRTVLFAPEDLALVKGDPGHRRRFLDDLLVVLFPQHAGTRSDYDRVLKQRNALLKSARAQRFSRTGLGAGHLASLDVWDQHLAAAAAELLAARLDLVRRLNPRMESAYTRLTDGSKALRAVYRTNLCDHLGAQGEAPDDDGPGSAAVGTVAMGSAGPGSDGGDDVLAAMDTAGLTQLYVDALAAARDRELERGMTLVGPHRDELELMLGAAPARGYASHGESWSVALSLRLASYDVLGDDEHIPANDPILILDDVFAELDAQRRSKLAVIVSGAEQVLVTAAVAEDVPAELAGAHIQVIPGGVLAHDR